jgi:hypothetical protein
MRPTGSRITVHWRAYGDDLAPRPYVSLGLGGSVLGGEVHVRRRGGLVVAALEQDPYGHVGRRRSETNSSSSRISDATHPVRSRQNATSASN